SVGTQPEEFESLRAGPVTIEALDLVAQGHPDETRVGKPCLSKSHPRIPGEAAARAVGDTGSRIGLMDRQRYLLATRGEVGGCGGVTAEAHDDVDLPITDVPGHGVHRRAE